MTKNNFQSGNYSADALHIGTDNSVNDDAEIQPIQIGGNKKVKRDDVIYFAAQLAVMVETGITLPEAIDSIADQTEHPSLQKILRELSSDVQQGIEFSTALKKHEKVFGTLFIALMKASEVSGTMGAMLQRASKYLQQERDTINRIKGAMTYPICMLSFCVVIIICLLVFILPRFEKIYAGKGAILPTPTRILLAMSHGLTDYWVYILIFISSAAVAGWFYLKSPAGRLMVHTLRIKLPIIGGMYRKAYLARSLRSMATMVTSGVGILDGLDITAEVAGNDLYQNMWTQAAESVKQGAPLSESLFATNLIPRSIVQMIQSGEKSGRLAEVMDRVAEFCEEDLKVAVKTITDMIEPAMIIIMGFIVGGIALALLLPVFKLSKVMTS